MIPDAMFAYVLMLNDCPIGVYLSERTARVHETLHKKAYEAKNVGHVCHYYIRKMEIGARAAL